MKRTAALLAFVILSVAGRPVFGQQFSELSLPPGGNGRSQQAEVSQWIGLVKIAIAYHSPSVHGPGGADRTGRIWGGLAPYGFFDEGFGPSRATPWRAGANESTTITFSHDVKLEGQDIKGGFGLARGYTAAGDKKNAISNWEVAIRNAPDFQKVNLPAFERTLKTLKEQPLRAADQVHGEIGTRIDVYLSRLVPFGWSGAVLIARDGEVVLNKGYGLANRADDIPWTSETVGNIGSITKQFTAAAILKLEAMGKLRVEDLISTYLPGVPADKSAVTLHQLLTHSSGLRGDLGGSDDEAVGRDELVARVLASNLAHAPGQTFEYSNEGYSLLAAIVERVSGKSYEAFLHDELFVPAGMTKTGYLLPTYANDQMARGYRADGTDWGLVYKRGWRADGPGWYLTGNGGIQSTTGDLYRWHLALENDSVLPAVERAKLFKPYVPTPGGDVYAYGWGVEQTPRGTTVVSHNGGNGIYFADFRRYVDEKTVIIALGNTPVIPATFIAMNRLEPLVFSPAMVPMPPAIVSVPAEVRAPLTGSYALESGGAVTVASSGSGLRADSSDLKLAATLQGFVPPGGRFADIEQKTAAIAAASAKGDFQPVVDAYGGVRTLAQVRAGQGQDWQDWQRDFGDFAGLDILGETFIDGDPAVVVRLRFARGSTFVQYPWGPRRLLGFAPLEALPANDFLPESATSYVRFDYRRASPVRIVFARTTSGAEVRIAGEGGEIVAKRTR